MFPRTVKRVVPVMSVAEQLWKLGLHEVCVWLQESTGFSSFVIRVPLCELLVGKWVGLSSVGSNVRFIPVFRAVKRRKHAIETALLCFTLCSSSVFFSLSCHILTSYRGI
ncbi:hypothetical protein GOBAR_DD29764 [Gossypium barbadense]|nr:hypothetical protein GOBAR_DD29764 [Gossypium barbadense]